MPITRAQCEYILINRLGPILTTAGMDGTTDTGDNASLNDPIGYAIRKLGYTVAEVTSVADTDLVAIPEADIDALLDIAELRCLENCMGSLTLVDITVGERTERFSQLHTYVTARFAALKSKVNSQYGQYTDVSVDTGSIALDFADHNEDVITDNTDDEVLE